MEFGHFNTSEFENRPPVNDDYCIAVADSFIAERAEERNLQNLLNSITDETILLALTREKQKPGKE